jgi:hypothetical protein
MVRELTLVRVVWSVCKSFERTSDPPIDGNTAVVHAQWQEVQVARRHRYKRLGHRPDTDGSDARHHQAVSQADIGHICNPSSYQR